jgi:hypothetical protein
MQVTNQELLRLWANAEKRKSFLKSYKEWGTWLTVSELGLTYFKYELPKGGRIVAMEYQRATPYPMEDEERLQTIAIYYLWDGEHFIPNPAGEYYITDRLKNLKMELQKELRTKTTA